MLTAVFSDVHGNLEALDAVAGGLEYCDHGYCHVNNCDDGC